VIRKLTTLAALILILPPALFAQSGSSALSSGKEHLRRDEYGMAVRSFTSYVSQQPKNTLGYDLRASTLLRMDSLDAALRDIEQSQQLDSGAQTGYFSVWLSGIAYQLQGDGVRADSALSRASTGSPAIAGERIKRARQSTDEFLDWKGEVDKASDLYRLKLAELLLDEAIDYQLLGD